jgi:myo-inositol-1(or 4)-monophosphatase
MSSDQTVDFSSRPGPFLAVAVDAVLRAGAIHLAHRKAGFRVSFKGRADLVTDVDLEVESMFRDMIAQRFPEHGVLAEEMAESLPSGGAVRSRWLFDPLDGTSNYAHGIPFYCAALALEIDTVVETAAVFDPTRGELFAAERGRGAWLNGEPFVVSKTADLADAMLGTGFPHGLSVRDTSMEALLGEYATSARAVRRLGSAALDLCYVACGRMDGFWDENLKPWDTAAGALIVREAGGRVTALDGSPFDCYSGSVLASNGHIHDEMVAVSRKAFRH